MGKNITASMFRDAFLAGAKNLEAKKEWINELNVFPVPDGDTGTNMTMTIMSAAKEAAAIKSPTMESVSKAISSGSLRGARGNSGVILSQLIRGLTREIKEEKEVDCITLAAAFNRACETAYKAVMKPKEGTILTVARGMADKAIELSSQYDEPVAMFEEIVLYGDEVLQRTPEMLPVLKEAGVVDSGGQGLMVIVKGALAFLKGEELDLTIEESQGSIVREEKTISTEEIRFGYCTEFIINLVKPLAEAEVEELKRFLESIGDSIVCVADDDIVKIHVHTNHPGEAFEKGLTYGSLSRMKVDNMREEHEERLIKNASELAKQQAEKKEPEKEFGFIAVSAGDGLSEIFKGVGVDEVIEGGQTMNPSTEDILEAASRVKAKNVFILPNNKNIILAANQAADLCEDRKVMVIPSQTIPQGITAMIQFMPEMGAEENLCAMKDSLKTVKSGQITYAVRNTSIDGKEIHEGDIMGIADTGLVAVCRDIDECVLETLKQMKEEDSELITLYYGDQVEEEAAEDLRAKAEELCGCEVDLQRGGQPIYYYFISVE